MPKILYQGHSSFRLVSDNDTVIYIDPYAGSGYNLKADAIFITHEHYDHNRTDLVKLKENAKIYRSCDMLTDGVYRTIKVNDIEITSVPAYNEHHNKAECVGYLITIDKLKLYFAGDTGETEFMHSLADKMLDYAFLPMDGVYTMTPQQAAQCAELINPKYAVPIHTKVGGIFDMKAVRAFRTKKQKIIMPNIEVDL